MFVKLTMTFAVDGEEDLDGHTDDLFRELLALEEADPRLTDSDMDVVLAEKIVTIRIAAEADNPNEGCEIANSAIRAAIHAAGGSTPDWEAPNIGQHSAHYHFRDQSVVPA